ncbi:hypothetical protein C3L33_11510, partial [Rhododendron williamsianum]
MGSEHGIGYLPLFETRRGKGRILYRVFAASVFVGIVLIWLYRASHIPRSGEDGRLGWIGLLGAELWFGLYWVSTQSLRWNRTYRYTFKDRLSQRYGNDLPRIDIFVCTANPEIEPPIMVANTVLSVMAYDYPPEKIAVYLSDDGGSDLTFYALLEASRFSQHWLPFCKKFNVEPRVYFSGVIHILLFGRRNCMKKWRTESQLQSNLEESQETRLKPQRIFQWNSSSSRRDHDTILQVNFLFTLLFGCLIVFQLIIDGRDPNAKDIEGCALPTLVYLTREKRPQYPHNFKAGAMNALIRVSSEISNGQVILNVDCDMYSNNSCSVVMRFASSWMKRRGMRLPLCSFRRILKTLRRMKYTVVHLELNSMVWTVMKALCTLELVASTGEILYMGLRYGCPVEDVMTGLSIQCLGWKSVYYNPARKGFLGVAATSLDQTLLQHKRWSEGDLQVLLSRYSPAWYALGRISPGLLLGYCSYCLWAPNSLATVFYSTAPSLYLLRGISLFPQVSSPCLGMVERSTDLALQENNLLPLCLCGYHVGVSWIFGNIFHSVEQSVRSRRVPEVRARDDGIRDLFPMFTILATLAMLNLISFVCAAKRVVTDVGVIRGFDTMALQFLLCGVLVLINVPLYWALFFRKDKGKMPSSITAKSVFYPIVLMKNIHGSLVVGRNGQRKSTYMGD